MQGCARVILTPYVTRHRFFVFGDPIEAPDDTIVVITLVATWKFGVLSSSIHIEWADSAGGRLGIGNDNRYNTSLTFAPFPFPSVDVNSASRVANVAERLDTHRKSAIARDQRVTMTGMYNVVDKLRSGAPLTPKERAIHEIAACGVLRDLHDELDQLVAEAYGWPWPMEKEEILERLVALHDERVEEEKRGVIRWLRPDYQIPRFAASTPAATLDLTAARSATPVAVAALPAWPTSAVDQLAAISALVSRKSVSADEATASFTGARRDLVLRHLGTLELMGEIVLDTDGRYQSARKVA